MATNSHSTPDYDAEAFSTTTTEDTPGDFDSSGHSEGTQEADPFNIPTPSSMWRFNHFLLELENEINDDELRKLKELFRGEIGHAVLQETTTATELFRLLRQRLLLSRDNLLYLQKILMTLQRPDLDKLARKYAREEGDCLHFYPASDQPENGYKFVKFHVEGKDFKSFKRQHLMTLRHKVSTILIVPAEYVLIAGVEPSSSMLITFMIPERYVRTLETLMQDNLNDLQELSDLGIDTIAIDDQVTNIHGVADAEVVETEQQSKLVNVYQQLQSKTKQLDDRDIECIKLSRRLAELEKQQNQDHMETEMLRKLFGKVDLKQASSLSEETKPASLSSQSSLILFKTSLRQIEDRGYDKDLIGQLLAANTDVIVTRMRDASRITILQMQLAIQDLQSQMIPQQLELERLRFQGRLEMVLMDFLQMLKQTLKVNVELAPFAITTLRKLTQKLRDREKKKLMKKYNWSDNEKLKIAMDDDPDLLLACLYLKEVEKTQQQVNFDEYISSCLMEVNRADLKKKFLDMGKHAPMPPRPESIQIPSRPESFRRSTRTGSLPRESRKSSVTDDQPQPGQNVDMAKMASQMSEVHTKVGRIDDIIQKTQVGYDDVFKKEPMSTLYGNVPPSWGTAR